MTKITEKEAAELCSIAAKAAAEAARLALRGFRSPKVIRYKGPIDVVTDFDVASEELIVERLSEWTPGIPIVAEERGGAEGDGVTWFVDPIDGTTNYAHGHPFWCVSIGLAGGGRCLAGAVVAPALAVEWTGSIGSPSRRNGVACRVSECATLDRALLATGFPYDRRTSSENNFAEFMALKKLTLGVRRCGSAAIDLCFVADGTYDGYWECKLSPWDVVAGAAIVLAAGGAVTDLGGAVLAPPLDPRDRAGYLAASNGMVHGDLIGAVKAARSVPVVQGL
jgi:myo-inositol-1(or 4)-monophosphatase